MSVHLANQLQKPLLVEGPAGVGKTEIAKVMSLALGTDLIRLQCYEGLDTSTALYEWNYQRQPLQLRIDEHSEISTSDRQASIFSDAFLLKRPLLRAITHHRSPVLLIDELDRADEEFESCLLEVLSDWQVSIPELGTVEATFIPHVIITSSRDEVIGRVEEIREGFEGNHLLVVRQGLPMIGCRYIVLSIYATMVATH